MTSITTRPQQWIDIQLTSSVEGAVPWLIRPFLASEQPSISEPGKNPGDILVEKGENALTLWVSLGMASKLSPQVIRNAGGSAGKWLLSGNADSVALYSQDFEAISIEEALLLFIEGVKLGAYRFNRYKTGENLSPRITLKIITDHNQALEEAIHKLNIVTDSVLLAREWGHEPANVINPPRLAELAQTLAHEYGLKCTILDEKDLQEMNAGAILAVGKGSQTSPRLIILEYPGKASQKPLVLVGKALTFDSGGLSLKDTNNIQGMKYDKCGGIAVLATMVAVTRLGLEQPVIGVIGAAENMISENAYRPDDIVSTLSGKSVEIISTDAEGRLVLADALTFVQKQFQPSAIIDLATLTGGVIVALGRVRAGLMANNDHLAQTLLQAGKDTGELLWQLPLDEEYDQLTKGDDADLKNSGGREAHPILGGIFLKQFVDDSIPWAHLDIAGMADTPKDLPCCPKGATGFGVRLLVHFIQKLT
ncbi:leucyl aminopeptidase [Anaerolinea thermolimosa]|uniref:leucyl aminopeptidase family protein n=1 Tax=Anaerolinea thermolimosa TaxID=229919 RepID=UPI000A013C7C|nr:leucyl aminopeptidase [Anaerolinea thermolimosa]GAP06727.1 leucyl aminopeptidase [Anaerolinea thermolimosa]